MTSALRPPATPHRTIVLGDAADSFGIYHDLVQSSGANTSRIADAFSSTVTAYNFPRLMLFDRQLVGAEHRREPRHIRRDGFEHFYLVVLRSGRMASGPLAEVERLSPGDAILFDATQPQQSLVMDADYLTVTLARDLVEAVVPNARRWHGRILPRFEAGSIGETVLALARRSPDLATGTDRTIVDLLAEATGNGRALDHAWAADAKIDSSHRLNAELFIDANLGRHDLDVGTVARGIGVSRSALYRAFEDVGGIERTIGRRRAARLRSVLLRPDEARSIQVLAHEFGFSSSSHCSRAFKKFYGLSPIQLRSIQEMTDNDLRLDLMREWYRDLNLSD